MVTHDARAAAVAHRVLFLADGEIVREVGECDPHTIHSVLEELAAASGMTWFALRGLGPQAPDGADGHRDRPRRRDDQRHLRPDGLDRQRVRQDLHRHPSGLRRGHQREVRLRHLQLRRIAHADLRRVGAAESAPSCSEVAQAEGSVSSDTTHLIDKNGKVIQFGLGGAPNLGFSIANPDSRFNPLSLLSGHWPGPGEVVIDKETASKKHLEAGQSVGVQVEGPVEQFKIAGIMQFSSGLSIGGATLAGFDLKTAQTLFRKRGQFDEIAVAAKPNVTPAQLARAIRPILPPDAQVKTAAQQVKSDSEDTNSFISFLRGFLLAFGGIALFVGSFVIANSLSITIAQRTRELATLRTLGASRRQVLRSIIVEALVMGTLASVVGLFLGLAIAKGLFGLFDLVGFTLPNTGLVFLTRTSVIVALLAGILVTLAASLRPAIRATRVPPIAAVREGSVLPPPKHRRLRGVGAALMAVGGVAAIAFGIFANGLSTREVLTWMGLGTLLMFLGVSLFSSRFVRPLAWVLGWPATRAGGAAGVLARDNARRNPQRTASTAAALMIGLTLVTLVATLASGLIASFSRSVDDVFVGDYAITAQNNFSPIPIDAAAAAATAPGVTSIGNVRTGEVRVFGSNEFATAVDPGMADVISMTWTEGSQAVFSQLGANGVFVDNGYAKDHALHDGLPRADHVPERQDRDVRSERRVRSAVGRIPVRNGHDLAAALGSRRCPRPRTSSPS